MALYNQKNVNKRIFLITENEQYDNKTMPNKNRKRKYTPVFSTLRKLLHVGVIVVPLGGTSEAVDVRHADEFTEWIEILSKCFLKQNHQRLIAGLLLYIEGGSQRIS